MLQQASEKCRKISGTAGKPRVRYGTFPRLVSNILRVLRDITHGCTSQALVLTSALYSRWKPQVTCDLPCHIPHLLSIPPLRGTWGVGPQQWGITIIGLPIPIVDGQGW